MPRKFRIPKYIKALLISFILFIGAGISLPSIGNVPLSSTYVVHASKILHTVKNATLKHVPIIGHGTSAIIQHHNTKLNNKQVAQAQSELKKVDAYLKKHPHDKKAEQLKNKLTLALNKAKTKSTNSSNSEQSNNDNSDGGSTSDPLMGAALKVSSSPSQYQLSKETTAPGSTWSMLAGSKNGIFSQSAKDDYDTDYRALYDSQGTGVKNDANIDHQEGNAAYYGLDLQNTGLDHSSAKSMFNSMIKGMGRLAGGFIPLIGNFVVWMAYMMFKVVTKVLNMFNPLMWVNGFNGHVPTVIKPLTKTLSSLIKTFTGLGLIGSAIILLASVGFAILGVKFANSQRISQGTGVGHACLRFLLRTFNILILPICCLLFLNIMMGPLQKAFSPDYDAEENYAVFSNLVDDKAWIQHSRLALPGGSGDNATLQSILPADNISGSVPTITHDQVLRVNADGAGLPSAQGAESAGASSKNVEGGKYKDPQSSSSGNVHPSQLIEMWMGNVDYSASEYSSFVKSHLNNLSGNQKSTVAPKKNNTGNASQMLSTLTAPKPNGYKGNIKYPFVNNGSVSAQGAGVQTNKDGSPGDVSANGKNRDFTSKQPSTKTGPDTNPSDVGGLSTIGMYNYLLTIFHRGDMMWVSNPTLTNSMTSTQHYNAGLAGKGLTAIGNYAMMCALIWAIGILGFAMAIFALKGIIIGIFKIFAEGAQNALGSMKGAVRLVMGTFALIFEVMGSAIMFSIGQSVLTAIARMPSTLLGTDAYTNKAASAIMAHLPHVLAAGQASRGIAYPFANIGLAFLMIYICLKIIKLRGPILGSFSRMSEDIMNKVFGSIDASAGSGGGLQSSRFGRGPGLVTTGDQDNQNAKSGNLLDRGLGLQGAQSKRGPTAGNGGGPGGSYNRGQANRRAQIQNPGFAGKIYNAVQNAKDVMDAGKGKAGRQLTTGEKLRHYGGYLAKNGLARTLGAIGLGGIGNHMLSAQQAHIDNDLQNYGDLQNANAQTGKQPLGSGVATAPGTDANGNSVFGKSHLSNGDISSGADKLYDQLHPGAQGNSTNANDKTNKDTGTGTDTGTDTGEGTDNGTDAANDSAPNMGHTSQNNRSDTSRRQGPRPMHGTGSHNKSNAKHKQNAKKANNRRRASDNAHHMKPRTNIKGMRRQYTRHNPHVNAKKHKAGISRARQNNAFARKHPNSTKYRAAKAHDGYAYVGNAGDAAHPNRTETRFNDGTTIPHTSTANNSTAGDTADEDPNAGVTGAEDYNPATDANAPIDNPDASDNGDESADTASSGGPDVGTDSGAGNSSSTTSGSSQTNVNSGGSGSDANSQQGSASGLRDVGGTEYAMPDSDTPSYAQNYDPGAQDAGTTSTKGIAETSSADENNNRINSSYQNLQAQTKKLHSISPHSNPTKYRHQKARVNTARGILQANRENAFNTFGKQTLGQKFMRSGWQARGHVAPSNVSTLHRINNLRTHMNNFNSAVSSGNRTGIRHARHLIHNDQKQLVRSGVKRTAIANPGDIASVTNPHPVNIRRIAKMQNTLNIGFSNAANGHMNPR